MDSDPTNTITGEGTTNLLPIFFIGGALVFIVIGVLSCTGGNKQTEDNSVENAEELLREEMTKEVSKPEPSVVSSGLSKSARRRQNKKSKAKNEPAELNEEELEKSFNKLSKIFLMGENRKIKSIFS